jgi:hypothetical protein
MIFLLSPSKATAFEPLFHAPLSCRAGSFPISFCVGDLDGDKDLDLAVANNYGYDISILLNNGDGTLASAMSYGAGNGGDSVCPSDFDGDDDVIWPWRIYGAITSPF